MVSRNLCPVCGYEMQDPPRDYNICPCCGAEFGHHDVNASIPDLRSAWLRTGPKWWSTVTPAPENWNPLEQLANVFGTVGTVRVPVAMMYPQQTIYPVPKLAFPFCVSGNAGFTEPERLYDVVSPAVIELKEPTAA